MTPRKKQIFQWLTQPLTALETATRQKNALGLVVFDDVKGRRAGFTLTELLMVVVILLIGALAVIPMMSSSASVQVEAAADMLAADLEYAKSLAISHSGVYRVSFNLSQNYYQVMNSFGTVVDHPVKHQDFIVDFDALGDLDRVKIDSANFDGSNELRFDYLGSPYNGNGCGSALNSGTITLKAGSVEMGITVEPVTGMIKVNR